MKDLYVEKIKSVCHWTDTLFSFTCTRSASFRFLSGQFTMVGLIIDGKPLMRAYSMVNATYDDHLEFLSIKVPNGTLTRHLKKIQVGDEVLIGRKATGTLLLSNLRLGQRLWLIATGTGLAPFLSIIKDPAIYSAFNYVVLTHTCRYRNELVYRDIIEMLNKNQYLGEFIRSKLIYVPTVTRDDFFIKGRITDLIQSGQLFRYVNDKIEASTFEAKFDAGLDRIMICGAASFAREFVSLLPNEFEEGNANRAGHYVTERAFLE